MTIDADLLWHRAELGMIKNGTGAGKVKYKGQHIVCLETTFE